MFKLLTAIRVAFTLSLVRRTALFLLLLSLTGAFVFAQGVSSTDGTTPPGLSPGAPAGSYALSGFDNVNLYNGNLNFHLPLLNIGGRGKAGYTMMQTIDSKQWLVNQDFLGTVFTPEFNWWTSFKPELSPGVMNVRTVATHPIDCTKIFGIPEWYTQTMTRLTFTAADETEYELRDAFTNGSVIATSFCNPNDLTPLRRGKIWVTGDGSAATFVSDDDFYDNPFLTDGPVLKADGSPAPISGWLLMRDGTRYRIDNRKVTRIRDANGNQIDFLPGGEIRDSLNRKYTVSTDANGNDTISFRGFNNTSRQIKILRAPLSTLLRSDFPLPVKTLKQLFLNLDGSSTTPFNPAMISAVELPDGRKYEFRYNYHGELAKVILPTGGAFEYDWEAGPGADTDGVIRYTVGYITGTVQYVNIYRRVKEKRVYSDANNSGSLENKTIFTVSHPGYADASARPWTTTVKVEQKDAAGTLLSSNMHYFFGSPTGSLVSYPYDYPEWDDGKEFKSEALAADSTSPLRRVNQSWQNAPGAPTMVNWHLFARNEPPNNSRLVETVTRLFDVTPNQYSKSSAINPLNGTVGFDEYNNQTDSWEYDLADNSPPTTPVRHVVTSYLKSGYDTINQSDPPASIHIRSLATQQVVYAGTDTTTPKAKTTYEYDTYTEGLTPRANLTGHKTNNYNTSFVTRGNLTQVTNCLLQGTSCTPLSTRMQYDIAGNVVKSTDALGRSTDLVFDDAFGIPDNEAQNNVQGLAATELGGGLKTFAFATKVSNALAQSAYTQFDYYLGKPVNGEDANGVVNSGRYGSWSDDSHADALDRASELEIAVNYPVNSGIRQRTRFAYDDTNKIISTTSDHTAYGDANPFKSEALYDGLGRTIESRQYESATSFIKTTQSYDALGRAYRSDNPLRSVSDPTDPGGLRQGYSIIAYDILSRVSTVKTYDKDNNPTGTVLTQYSGSYTTVTDQADKLRRSKTDGLGRLVRVDEPNAAGALGSFTAPNQPTSYTYDTLDNLTQVNQGAQNPRQFVYDSLKRLTSATNPESGAVSYTYDENSNLKTKLDARGITTTYDYDDLNRVTSRTYTGGTPTTPPVTYTYENAAIANSTGRLTRVSNGVSATDYNEFDALGRVKKSTQTTAGTGQGYEVLYGYNLAGEMTSETYPSGRVISMSYDTAGRLTNLSGTKTGEAAKTYASQINYTAHGGVASLMLGNGKYEHTTFNNRLQPTQIGLGTSAGDSSVLRLDYTYGSSTNNGNVLTQQIVAPGLDVKQTYTYDQCNRLLTASESPTATPLTVSWKQTFTYDPFGNRNFDTDPTDTFPPQVLGANPSISQSNNRINAEQGYLYDEVGNVKQEPSAQGNKSYTYDGENHQVSFAQNSQTTSYGYDGDGRRVRRINADGSSVVFVYNVMGQMIAEYTSGTPQPVGGGGTSYLTTDHLGSTRVVSKSDGSVKARYDFLPFGEELMAGIGGRTSGQGYGGADATRQKFTGHERDLETGLDFMQARYCSSVTGRFMSADSVAGSPGNPQSLNLYCYVMNNPLAYSDPTGHSPSGGQDRIALGGGAFWGNVNAPDRRPYPGLAESITISSSSNGSPQIQPIAADTSMLASFNRSISSFVVGNGEGLESAITAPHTASGPNELIGNGILAYAAVAMFLSGSGAATVPALIAEVGTTVALPAAAEMFAEQANEGFTAAMTTKQGGKFTEPTLPNKVIAEEGNVSIEQNYRSNDHAPAHAHVKEDGKTVTRIGANGNPIMNDPALSAAQRAVVENNKSTIRTSLNKITRWIRFGRMRF